MAYNLTRDSSFSSYIKDISLPELSDLRRGHRIRQDEEPKVNMHPAGKWFRRNPVAMTFQRSEFPRRKDSWLSTL